MKNLLLMHNLEQLRVKLIRRPHYQLTKAERELVQRAINIAPPTDPKATEIAKRHGFKVSTTRREK